MKQELMISSGMDWPCSGRKRTMAKRASWLGKDKVIQTEELREFYSGESMKELSPNDTQRCPWRRSVHAPSVRFHPRTLPS